jgi:glyoxylase-like metal-dependent hydrolase (beta-lactamase superfamily II)
MNALEHQLDYVFRDNMPVPGTLFEVASGVFWLRMPLPFALDHINLWLLRDQDEQGRAGWTIIDCGIHNEIIKQHWEEIFEHHLEGLPVLRLLCTHFHPDHLGLADWLTRGGDKARWNVRLWMTLGEYTMGRVQAAGAAQGSSAGGETAARHFARNGLTDPEGLAQIRERAGYFTRLVPTVPPAYRRLREGDTVRIGAHDWRVITGYGHSTEHCALYCAALEVLISGDMVLPRISTNVSVFDLEPEGNPLALYLESLDRYDGLPAQTLTLPSHGKPFRGLHARLRQLREHHVERLAEVRAACAVAPQSAADIVPLMFKRKLDMHQMTFALGEALAHLHLLWHADELKRDEGADGVFRFASR